jgi:hypothetical protein
MQNSNDSNSIKTAVPQGLWIAMAVSVVLLLMVGGTLYFAPSLAQLYWPWKLTPFNTRFLGAMYLSAVLPLLFCIMRPQSAPLRIVLPMFAFFTTFLLLVSCAHISSFHESRTSSHIWFGLYGMDSFVALYFLWSRRQQLLRMDSVRSPRWPTIYRAEAILLGGYGGGLLLAAPLFAPFWPWPLDEFHSHLYSGLFLAGALANWYLSHSASWIERLTLGLTQTVLGGLIGIGMWVVDAKLHRLNWASPSPWIWLTVFGLFCCIGLIFSLDELRQLRWQPSTIEPD